MTVAAATLTGAYLQPSIPLDGPTALVFFAFTEMAGKYGATVLICLLTVVVISRPNISGRTRLREGIVILITLAFCASISAYFNEHILKPWLSVPRPVVLQLVLEGRIDLDAEGFYGIGDKVQRSLYLAERLPPGTPGMHDIIRRHWIQETGYSFPSGHSLSAMTIATYFLAWGFAALARWRWRLMQALVVWAVLAAYSRPLLRVHTATDILVGALEGILVGLLAFMLSQLLLRDPSRSRKAADGAPRVVLD